MSSGVIKDMFTPFADIKPRVMKTIFGFHIVAFLFTWYFLVPEKSLVPNLGEVLVAMGDMWSRGLFFQILSTLELCGYATVIGIIISCIISYASTIPFFYPIATGLTKLRYNPIQGFTLFLSLMSGGGRKLQITLLIIFMSFYFINSLMTVVGTIPPEDLIRRRTQRMGAWKTLWKVAILDRGDYLIEVVRQNLSMMFMMIVSVEAMDKTQGGIGAMILDNNNRGAMFPKVFALQLIILAIGILLDFILKKLFYAFPANKKQR